MTFFRELRPVDLSALQAAHQRQCAALGCQFGFPDLSDPRYLLTLVAERDGVLIGALTAHATIELMFLGGDPLMVRATIRDRSLLAQRLRTAGCDEAHAFVPNVRLPAMAPLLRRLGFRRSNSGYTPFYASL
ncbi:MAG: hypothetical protein ACRD04_05645 [Terriglobales bacterium]